MPPPTHASIPVQAAAAMLQVTVIQSQQHCKAEGCEKKAMKCGFCVTDCLKDPLRTGRVCQWHKVKEAKHSGH